MPYNQLTNLDYFDIRNALRDYLRANSDFTDYDFEGSVISNLLDVLALDSIDYKRTFSNDIMEVYNVFGIEAARQTIYVELAEVLEFDGNYIKGRIGADFEQNGDLLLNKFSGNVGIGTAAPEKNLSLSRKKLQYLNK
jgi:hypothetical protein